MKIIFWSGAAWEPWGPSSPRATGIGGSETAVVELASWLATLGHEVTSIGEHRGHEGLAYAPGHPGSVEYVDYRSVTEGGDATLRECDVLVSSRDKRSPRVLDFRALHKVLWMHDIAVGDDHARDIEWFDQIYCLSRWARNNFLALYPEVEPRQVVVTRNGIDPSRFLGSPTPDKGGRRLTWSSSPDRGLAALLDMWPKLRAIAPGLELHVYYGTDTWRKMAASMPGQRGKTALLQVEFLEQRARGTEGVTWHGRQPQDVVADSHRRSTVWAYPTSFRETYCITALEAQAAGALPVATKLAALEETAALGELVNPDTGMLGIGTSFEDRFVEAFRRTWEADDGRRRLACREWALTQTWEGVARDWDRMFVEAIAVERR